MRKLAPAPVSHRDDSLISYRLYMIRAARRNGSHFSSSSTMPSWIVESHACATCSVYRETDFIPKRVVVLRLHDTVARFLTGMKFWPRYSNRGELAPV